MIEYPKIESLYNRDEKTHKFIIPAGSPIHYCWACGCYIYWIETGRRRKVPVDLDRRGHVCLGKIKREGM